MTIVLEPPGMWFLTCDGCQERIELDVDPDDSFQAAVNCAKFVHGYQIKEESHQYSHSKPFGRHLYKTEWVHRCQDCKEKIKSLNQLQQTTMTNVVIAIQESRPYGLGYQAFEDGVPRTMNPMLSDSGREKWHYGWDAAQLESRSA